MPRNSSRLRTGGSVATAFLIAAASGLVLTGTAHAQDDPISPDPDPGASSDPSAPSDPDPSASTTRVTAASRADVHAGPNNAEAVVSHVAPNVSYPAECWEEGGAVTVKGKSRNSWVKLQLKSGGEGYVNAIYLKGDEHGNVTNQC
jgi:hypothetical protein